MNEKAILSVEGIVKHFGSVQALKGVALELFAGEVLGLVGENGSGKSTLTSIIAGMQPANDGSMWYDDKVWQPASMIDALKKGIGMIVQETGTIPGITVAENIFLGETDAFKGALGLINKHKRNEKAAELLKRFGAEHIFPHQITATLSLQDRKLVEIVRVLSKEPRVLVVDETTTALSQLGRDKLYGMMGQMKKEGKSVIFISHDLDEIMAVCDRLTVLRDGDIITHFKKAAYDEDAIKTSMIGRELKGDYYRADITPSWEDKVVLCARGIVTSGLKGIGLYLHKGEILGIGGLSHSGMHELGKALFGAVKLKSGSVEAGQKTISNPSQAIGAGVGYISKDRDTESLNTNASVKDNIAIAGMEKFEVGKLLFPWREEKYVATQVEALSIKCQSSSQYVATLSGGNKQKVAFAKWIGAGCDILILDCPTRGVDVGVKQAMYQLIHQLKKEGKSFVLISEELAELIGMCDRVLMMKNGAVEKEFLRNPELSEADMIHYMI